MEMENFKKSEEKPEFSDCSYICFYIDPSIYEKDGFILDSNILSFKEFKINNNLIIYTVHFGIIFNTLKFFKSNNTYFKISYEFNKKQIFTSNFYFSLEKNKIKYIYDAGKKGSTSLPELFKNPSCLEQYNAFLEVSQNYDILFQETINFLKKTLDIELFLYLLQNKNDKKDELMSILDNFPYKSIIQYEKKKPLQKMDFSHISNHENYKKLILIYSLIQDSTEFLNNFNEDDILLFINYNETQKDQPILIKKNIFEFFISKLNDENLIKKICQSVYSIPLLFDWLIVLNEEQFKKIKDLKNSDLTNEYSIDDNLIDLIDKYEKIKSAFCENEIDKVWKKYLNLWYKVKNIKELEEIIDKFNSINEKYYSTITLEIKNEITNKGKKLIKMNKLKSFDMYKFINKYNNIGDFFSDEILLYYIGANIILEELDKDENILKEFNQCKFMAKISSKLIKNYINGTLSQISNFKKFYLYFKYIYLLKEKENDEKNIESVNLIISHFLELLTKINNIEINDEFKDIVHKIIVLSFMYIPEDKKNNYIQIISDLGICPTFSRDDLFNLFIDAIINSNIEKFVDQEIKDKICEIIIKNFYNELNIEKKIDFLLKINSVEIKEKFISNFPSLNFSDFFQAEENISFRYLKNFIEKGVINNEEFSKITYFKNIIEKCHSFKELLEQKEINFSQVIQLKELIQKNKLSNRTFYICLGNKKTNEELEEKIKIYIEKYILYNSQLDILIMYYNKYYPNSKKEEIIKYSQQQSNFKEAKINICKIELNESIGDEIKIFEKYEKSRFFSLFYNDIKFKNENQELQLNEEELKKQEEDYKFKKAIEIFNECEKLFNGKDFELEFLEKPLIKLEDNETGDNLLKEITYLKENFGYKDVNEKQIKENLLLYKIEKMFMQL